MRRFIAYRGFESRFLRQVNRYNKGFNKITLVVTKFVTKVRAINNWELRLASQPPKKNRPEGRLKSLDNKRREILLMSADVTYNL